MASQAAEKRVHFVILSEARNLSPVSVQEKKERFLASLRMTKWWREFFRGLFNRTENMRDRSGFSRWPVCGRIAVEPPTCECFSFPNGNPQAEACAA
jgi:hypothetical protein